MKIAAQTPGSKGKFTLGPWVDGVDEKAEPGVLGPSQLRAAYNVLFDETMGLVKKRWGNKEIILLPSGLPPKFGYVFKKNDGTEYLLLSDGETIYATTDLNTLAAGDALITGLDDSAYQQYETAENKCWIFNGSDADMWFDGTDFLVLDHEYGNATAATGDAGTDTTHIVDASLTSSVTDYWKNCKVVITSGAAAGGEATVTAFNPATDKLTITPALTGLTNGDGYMVGLIMPKGRIARYAMGTLFIGATSENRSEIRFNRADDPDTGIRMSLDNPRAWPATHQLAITQDDGDQVWTFSPCYKDRVLVTKGTAIYRLEPDSTFLYRSVLVSQVVGCRYPDCWVVKDELLHFMGQERSGLLDLYVTDMVTVKPRHKEGNLIPSFQEMFRSEPTNKYIARASTDQFETGEKSTLCDTAGGRLACREIATKTDWDEVIVTAESVDAAARERSDSVTLKGFSLWPQRYECDVKPDAASPAWSKYSYGYTSQTITLGKLVCTVYGGMIRYYKNNVFDATKNIFAAIRVKHNSSNSVFFTVMNGVNKVDIELSSNNILVNGIYITRWDKTSYTVFHILLDKTGNGSVYKDGVRVWIGPAIAAAVRSPGYGGVTTNSIEFCPQNLGYTYHYFYFDFIYEDADYEYTAAQLGAALPASGSVTVKIDYKRAPEAFGKYWATLGNDFSGTTDAGGDATHIIDADIPYEDDFWNGRILTITSGTYAGKEVTVTDYVASTHTLTVGAIGGSPGAGVTFKINRGGTVAIQTQSSADDVTYSGLAACANGAQPSSGVAQYLKLKFTMTPADYVNAPELTKLIGGFLWRMKAVQIGTNISAWKTYLDEITVPAGTALAVKIRLAKTLAAPGEGDWEAWAAIVNTENIGTILSDTSFPITPGEGRWLDIKVEGGPDGFGVTPNLENFLLNWQEGATSKLCLTSFIFKKRLYMTGISSVAAANDRLYVLDTNKAWSKFIGLSLNRIIPFRGLIYGLSSINDKIYQLEVEGQYSDGVMPVDAYIETGALDFGNQRFEMRNIKVGSVGIISNVGVFLSYDGTNWTSIGTLAFTGDGTRNLRVPKGRIGKRHFIRLRVAAAEGMGINMLKVAGIVKAED